MTDARGPLLAWQLANYPLNHADRRNLVIHLVTVPMFMAGTLGAVIGLASASWPTALAGLAALPLAVALQGRGHALEPEPPLPFRGPLDVLGRIVAEQWVTFPRFVVSGGFGRAWAGSRATSRAGDQTKSPKAQ